MKHSSEYKEFLKWKEKRKLRDQAILSPYTKGDENNVLVIGDLHEPFCLEGYLEFCREQQEKFNCGTVVFIGDVIDSHYGSYHETSSKAMGGDDELEHAIKKIKSWYSVFPEAHVLIGNHDRLAFRKAQSGGIPSKWIRNYSEVLETPNWSFVEELIINEVCYTHGEGGTARRKMKDESMSVVQGHLHSQAYVEYSVGTRHRIFGVQVGCGIDRNSYAMSYGKNFKKPVVSCAVILDKGRLPIILPMEL